MTSLLGRCVAVFQSPCLYAISRRSMNKRRRIVTGRNHEPDRMIGTVTLINLDQPFAKGVYGYPHDGIGLRVKVRPPPEGFHRDRIFPNLICPTLKVLFAHVLEHSRQIAGPAEDSGVQQPFIFLPLGLCSGDHRFDDLGCPKCCHVGILPLSCSQRLGETGRRVSDKT